MKASVVLYSEGEESALIAETLDVESLLRESGRTPKAGKSWE